MSALSRRSFVAALPFVFVACSSQAGGARETVSEENSSVLTVYKTPSCGCCNAWVEHVKGAGFDVRAIEVADTGPIATQYAVPRALRSCHTAIVGGYAIEGHVPAREIRRLLEERPDVAGLAVPGMPIGSPGMEMGDRRDRYQVIAFDRNGRARVFANY